MYGATLDRQFVFVDECHRRGRDLLRRRAKGRHGRPVHTDNTANLSRAWTILAAMDVTGLVAHEIVELNQTGAYNLPKAMNRQRLMAIFRAKILPHLRPADHRKLMRSVVVVDNCSLHWGCDDENVAFVNELDAAVRSKGAVLVYTPPYCPRANAIEALFKAMNDGCRRNRALSKSNPTQAMREGLLAVDALKAATFVEQSRLAVQKWHRFCV